MGKLGPITWLELVRRLRNLGFEVPYQSGKHPYMVKDDRTVTIPNRHAEEIGVDLLARILRQAGIDRETWLE
jgi:predicted RNA binding protein YcfA (HicA-like mRNA interferase family)